MQKGLDRLVLFDLFVQDGQIIFGRQFGDACSTQLVTNLPVFALGDLELEIPIIHRALELGLHAQDFSGHAEALSNGLHDIRGRIQRMADIRAAFGNAHDERPEIGVGSGVSDSGPDLQH